MIVSEAETKFKNNAADFDDSVISCWLPRWTGSQVIKLIQAGEGQPISGDPSRTRGTSTTAIHSGWIRDGFSSTKSP